MKSILLLFLLVINSCAVVDYFNDPCEFRGETYEDGETFGNLCLMLICNDGEVDSNGPQPAVECDYCEFEDKEYDDGDIFGNECANYICYDGETTLYGPQPSVECDEH